jgi:hypothetical protein
MKTGTAGEFPITTAVVPFPVRYPVLVGLPRILGKPPRKTPVGRYVGLKIVFAIVYS